MIGNDAVFLGATVFASAVLVVLAMLRLAAAIERSWTSEEPDEADWWKRGQANPYDDQE